MSSATLDSSLPLDNSIGAMLLGVVVSGVLFGVCLLQTFIYFIKYKQDSIFLKTLVAITVIFDAMHLAFITHTIYHYLITNFQFSIFLQQGLSDLPLLIYNVKFTGKIGAFDMIEALFNGFNAAIVQTFYTYRIWRLSKKNYLLVGFILLLILATAGCGTAWVVLALQIHTFRDLLRITPLTISFNVLATTIDIIIASSLCFFLNKARTGFKRSDTVINRLMLFTINTGILTSCCAATTLILVIVSPNTLLYAAFYFCIGRSYTNSFLATLNARNSIKGHLDDTDGMVMSSRVAGLNPNRTIGESTQQKSISVRIETTTEASIYEDAVPHHEKDEKINDNNGFAI